MVFIYFHAFEYLSFLMALIFFSSLRKYSIGLFLPLLLMVCIIDTLGANYLYWFGRSSNIPVYNHHQLLHPFFYMVLFYQMLQPAGLYKKIYVGLTIALWGLAIAEFLFTPLEVFHNYTNVTSKVVYLILGFVLLSRLVTDDSKAQQPLYAHPYFWIATGIILFCLVAVFVTGLRSYHRQNKVILFGKPIYQVLMPMINCVFYSCYAYAFYRCYRNRHAKNEPPLNV